jgi:(R,R)-butanediol dehydrogenase/meso-butanediol dehydrogenase/diacetyl reductase
MRAAVYHGQRDVRWEDRPVPPVRPGELLVRVATTGICGTDVSEFTNGAHQFPLSNRHPHSGHGGPMIPGHEFSGHVVECGPGVTGFGPGDLVTSGAGVSCGACPPCRRGRTNLCERYWTVGLQRDGALAEYVAVPAAACVNLAGRGVSPDVAALSQPMSIALHAARRGGPEAGAPVVVLGTGAIGVFLTYALASLGADITAVDLDVDRLAVAAAVGAARTVQVGRDAPVADQLRDAVAPTALIFECTGVATSFEAALALSPRGGRIVVVGHQSAPVPVDLTQVSLAERELVGTVAHVFARDFVDAVELVIAGGPMWTRVAPVVRPLADLLPAGLDPGAGGPGQIKPLFDPALAEPRELVVAQEPG